MGSLYMSYDACQYFILRKCRERFESGFRCTPGADGVDEGFREADARPSPSGFARTVRACAAGEFRSGSVKGGHRVRSASFETPSAPGAGFRKYFLTNHSPRGYSMQVRFQ